jgi:hypothetical protein
MNPKSVCQFPRSPIRSIITMGAVIANVQRFPTADRVLTASVDEAFRELPIEAGAYVVAITRGHALDEEVAALALRTLPRLSG